MWTQAPLQGRSQINLCLILQHVKVAYLNMATLRDITQLLIWRLTEKAVSGLPSQFSSGGVVVSSVSAADLTSAQFVSMCFI